ncbi:MAG: site-2 protease family protein [Candidatus Pacebacteria bacterium]|nr:site-2 protease family protein [Candidatus Paceibacterota bacterium]
MDILIFFGVLLIIILVHEFGHFIVAKKSGIRVDEFGFGFPPKLFGKKIGETLYSFNLLPIGGFVKIFGETPDKESISGPDSKRSFVNKPKYVQASVLAAGVIFNFLLACLLFITIYIVGAPLSVNEDIPKNGVIENPQLTIVYIEPQSPAELAGLNPGDRPVALSSGDDVLKNPTDVQLQQFIATHNEIAITYQRGKNIENVVHVSPEENETLGRSVIGVTLDEIGILKLPIHHAILEGVGMTLIITKAVAIGLGEFFYNIFVGDADFKSVAGPVGIVGIVGDAAQVGVVSLLILTAVISINLALINLLPFPALDGGRLLLLIIEVITRKSIKPQIANAVNSIGFLLLLLLMAVVTYNDVAKLF